MENRRLPLQLAFDEAAARAIARLQEASGARTPADVVRVALGLYDWAREQIEAGATLAAVVDGAPVKEVTLPFRGRRAHRTGLAKRTAPHVRPS
jgi:hypothetical protein